MLELEKVEDDILNLINLQDKGFRSSQIDLLLNEFLRTNEEIMEVKWKGTYKSCDIAKQCLQTRVKRMKYRIRVARVRERLYLINLDRNKS